MPGDSQSPSGPAPQQTGGSSSVPNSRLVGRMPPLPAGRELDLLTCLTLALTRTDRWHLCPGILLF